MCPSTLLLELALDKLCALLGCEKRSVPLVETLLVGVWSQLVYDECLMQLLRRSLKNFVLLTAIS